MGGGGVHPQAGRVMGIACLKCGRAYPQEGVPYCCPTCGGLFDETAPLTWKAPEARAAGVWRYLEPPAGPNSGVSLGEGNTPLVAIHFDDRQIFFKCEYANPTGSFKDRGSAVAISFIQARGVRAAIEDSSGNAGASFAAYAARGGIRARVFMPASGSGPKRAQIESYGADVSQIPGSRADAAQAVLKAAQHGAVYASHAYLPHNLQGYGTCAFEIVAELGDSPGTVLLPAGQGGLLLGLARGFVALLQAGKIRRLPALVGVQAAACAPLVALDEVGVAGLDLVTEGPTVAEGVRVRTPLRAAAVLAAVRQSGGRFVAVRESMILPGRDSLARLGFYVEPTSAVVWQALNDNLPDLQDPIVVVLTGSGYKSTN